MQRLFFALLATTCLVGPFPAAAQQPQTGHGAVYAPPLRGDLPPTVAAQPGADAFYRMFEGVLPNLEIPERRALQLGSAVSQEPGQANPTNIRIPAGFTFFG